jgi:DNA polymerase-4
VQASRERKSVGAENTFEHDLYAKDELERELLRIAEKVWERTKSSQVKAKTVTLKYKYNDFEQHTRSKTVESYFQSKDAFIVESKNLLTSEGGFTKGIRLLGLTLSNFIHDEPIKEAVQLVIDF